MKLRSYILPALVLVTGVSLLAAGILIGRRPVVDSVAATAQVQPDRIVKEPRKPEPPPAKSDNKPTPQDTKTPANPTKPPTRKAVRKITVSDKEHARGTVVDPSGKPLSGAEVTIGGAWVTHAVSDSDGKFRIEVPQLEWKPGG